MNWAGIAKVIRKTSGVWVALMLSWSGISHAQAVLTLEDAVTLAAAHSRRVQSAALGPERADEQLAAARTERLPQFGVTAFAGELLNRPSVTLPGSDPGTTVRLNTAQRPLTFAVAQANLPLSQQYKIRLGLKSLELEKKLKAEEEHGIQSDITATVKGAYYKILLSEFDLKAAEFTQQVSVELERVTERYYEEKAVLRSDLLEVQSRRARAEYDAVVKRDHLAEQKESFNSMLGRPIETKFELAPLEEADSYAPDPTEIREKALAANPMIRQAQLHVKQARVAEQIKRAEYIPDVSLSMNYLSTTGLPSLFPQKIAAAGLLVSWQPFDWGRKRHEGTELARAEKQQLLSLKDEEEKIKIDVGMQVRRLTEARLLIAAARINQDRAQEEVRVMQVKYSTNAALMKNTLEAQAAAATAHAETGKALTEYWEAITSLDKLMGGR